MISMLGRHAEIPISIPGSGEIFVWPTWHPRQGFSSSRDMGVCVVVIIINYPVSNKRTSCAVNTRANKLTMWYYPGYSDRIQFRKFSSESVPKRNQTRASSPSAQCKPLYQTRQVDDARCGENVEGQINKNKHLE